MVTAPSGSGLGRLGGWCYDHRRRVLGGWVLGLILVVAVGSAVGARYTQSFGGGGQSGQVQDLLHQRFPAQAGDNATVVFTTAGAATDPANLASIDGIVGRLAPLAHVTGVTGPIGAARDQISPDGHISFATVHFDRQAGNLPNGAVNAVVHTAEAGARPGLAVSLGGAPIDNVVSPKPGSSEGIGVTAAILIMLIAFGSIVATGLPILTALVGVGAGFGIVDLVSNTVTDPSFGPEMMAMIGLGVGIDYALFIVTRYRQGLAEGRTPRQAVVAAQSTAGRSVVFAACTVVISLLGLLIVGQAFMVGLAIGAILAVLAVMAAAMTLLPAMLGFSGHAIDRLHIPWLFREATPTVQHGFWWRWSRYVQRRPWPGAIAAVGVLVVLGLPLFSMHLAFSDDGNAPSSLTTRQAYDALARGFGPGFNGPLVVAATLTPGPGNATGLVTLARQVAAQPGVERVIPAQVNQAGDAAVMIVYPTTSPQATATSALVGRLRSTVLPAVARSAGITALVGGVTAAGVDASNHLSSRLPWVIGLVLLVSFLLLTAVFRSIAIPAKAAVMNLLSIGAAYGVIVAVFQWGWLSSLFGARPGPIDPWIPLMMFTITFGLSMDYEVFLLSRMREEWRRTSDNAIAVADGLASTARVITAAAAIMVCVFGSFVIGDPLRVLDVFGLGLAAAIAVDATLVRMILVPSVMQLLGRANWWIPAGLDHVLPSLGVEGEPDQPVPAGAVPSAVG